MAAYTYQDTLVLKKNTWYKIRDEEDRNEIYFLWKGNQGDYTIVKKPLPGPGPW
jgi:hypothetical protein